MDDAAIRHRLEEYRDKIFCLKSVEAAKALDKELDAFYKENHVTLEQRRIIAESGAGEALYMLRTIPDE